VERARRRHGASCGRRQAWAYAADVRFGLMTGPLNWLVPSGEVRVTTPPRIDPELEAEQAYVDAAYARLESMRAAAERVREAYADVRAGGTHQARLERDIAYEV